MRPQHIRSDFPRRVCVLQFKHYWPCSPAQGVLQEAKRTHRKRFQLFRITKPGTESCCFSIHFFLVRLEPTSDRECSIEKISRCPEQTTCGGMLSRGIKRRTIPLLRATVIWQIPRFLLSNRDGTEFLGFALSFQGYSTH